MATSSTASTVPVGNTSDNVLMTPPPASRSTVHEGDEESPWLEHEPIMTHDSSSPTANNFWNTFRWNSASPSRHPLPQNNIPTDDEETIEQAPVLTLSGVWNSTLRSSKYLLLVMVIGILWPFGFMSFTSFTQKTDSTFSPLPGTPSYEAQEVFIKEYPNDWSDPMHPVLIVVLQSDEHQLSLTEATSPAYSAARNYSLGLEAYLNETTGVEADCNDCDKELQVKVTSHFSLVEDGLAWVASGMTVPDGTTVVMEVQYQIDETAKHPRELMHGLLQALEDYPIPTMMVNDDDNSTTAFYVSFTGIHFFGQDLATNMKLDVSHMDVIALPAALILMGLVLPKAHAGFVWIIPLITMISTVSLWSLIMNYFVVEHWQITQFTPSVMMSLTLGMGIDYTLILLSRFLEGDPSIITKEKRILTMLSHTSQVLLLSGTTLMTTFMGLAVLPLAMLQSVGIGAAIAIGSSLFINLTIVPTLLHTGLGDIILRSKISAVIDADRTGELGDESIEPINTTAAQSDETPVIPRTSFWYRLAKTLLHPYKSLIIFLLIAQLLYLVAQNALDLKTSINFDLLLPSTSPSLETFHSLGESMGWGRLAPYRILFDGHDANVTMTSVEGFDIQHQVIDELIAIDHASADGITHLHIADEEIRPLTDQIMYKMGLSNEQKKQQQEAKENLLCTNALELANAQETQYGGISVLKNIRVPHSLYNSAKFCASMKPYCPVEVLHILDFLDQSATSKDGYATAVSATLGVNPFSDEGIEWLAAARDTIDRLEQGGALGGVKVYIQGSAAIANDAVRTVMDAFPTVVAVTLAVIFILMGLFFQSIVTPLRSIISIAMTVSAAFGLSALVFRNGDLNWTKVRAWMTTGDEVSWLVPIMAFSIVVGLALDYDVFLVSRIREFRAEEHYGHKSSVVAGLHSTGGIITAAGAIMAVAFGALMMSSCPVLYQWSFLLTTAVLIDTLIIRTLVVPIFLGWTGKYSWWPLKMPPARIHIVGFEDDDDAGAEEFMPEGSNHLNEPLLTTPQRS